MRITCSWIVARNNLLDSSTVIALNEFKYVLFLSPLGEVLNESWYRVAPWNIRAGGRIAIINQG
jgi:hypothetical protein